MGGARQEEGEGEGEGEGKGMGKGDGESKRERKSEYGAKHRDGSITLAPVTFSSISFTLTITSTSCCATLVHAPAESKARSLIRATPPREGGGQRRNYFSRVCPEERRARGGRAVGFRGSSFMANHRL